MIRPRRAALALALATLALVGAACSAPLMKLPEGPGSPAADGPSALAEATATCKGIRTFSAELAVRGSIGGRGIPRSRLLVGVRAPDAARLEAPAPFGAPVFFFVARGDDATLLLAREDRVVEHAPAADLLDAITGVPLDAADLRRTLTGCDEESAEAGARQLGPDWRALSQGGDTIYLHRASAAAPWQLVAARRRTPSAGEWRVEYRDFLNGLPRALRLTSIGSERFDLQLSLSQVDVNVPLEDKVFEVQVPASAERITLDQLRQSGPVSTRSDAP